MTSKEKQIDSLKRRILKTEDILKRNTEKLEQLKKELEKSEIDELKLAMEERKMTMELIIHTIRINTNNAVNEQKIQIKTEEKKNAEF